MYQPFTDRARFHPVHGPASPAGPYASAFALALAHRAGRPRRRAGPAAAALAPAAGTLADITLDLTPLPTGHALARLLMTIAGLAAVRDLRYQGVPAPARLTVQTDDAPALAAALRQALAPPTPLLEWVEPTRLRLTLAGHVGAAAPATDAPARFADAYLGAFEQRQRWRTAAPASVPRAATGRARLAPAAFGLTPDAPAIALARPTTALVPTPSFAPPPPAPTHPIGTPQSWPAALAVGSAADERPPTVAPLLAGGAPPAARAARAALFEAASLLAEWRTTSDAHEPPTAHDAPVYAPAALAAAHSGTRATSGAQRTTDDAPTLATTAAARRTPRVEPRPPPDRGAATLAPITDATAAPPRALPSAATRTALPLGARPRRSRRLALRLAVTGAGLVLAGAALGTAVNRVAARPPATSPAVPRLLPTATPAMPADRRSLDSGASASQPFVTAVLQR